MSVNQDQSDLPDVNDPVLQAIEARNVEEVTPPRPLTMESVRAVKPEPRPVPATPPVHIQQTQQTQQVPQTPRPIADVVPQRPPVEAQPKVKAQASAKQAPPTVAKPEPKQQPVSTYPNFFATQPKAPVTGKIIITLLVIVFLAAIAGGIYYFWPTISNTFLG